MNYNFQQPPYPNPTGYQPGYRAAPQYQWAQQVPTLSTVRPVSSIEEVRACPIDFDGSVFYFADVANKRIYTKQINLDGTASINLYEQKEFQPTIIPDQQQTSDFVTKQEFDTAIADLKEMYEKLTTIQKSEDLSVAAQQPTTTQFQF